MFEQSLMVVDRAGERALAVAEELRLDDALRVLGQIGGDERTGEARREATALLIESNQPRSADGRRGRGLARPCLAEHQGGEIFHSIPQVLLVDAHVGREDVVPQGVAQAAHGGAVAQQRVGDEEVGAADLVEEREIAGGVFGLEAAGAQLRQKPIGKRGGRRFFASGQLLGDERVEVVHVVVIHAEQQAVTEELPIPAREVRARGHPGGGERFQPRLQRGHDGAEGVGADGAAAPRRVRHQGADVGARVVEGVAEDDPGDGAEELPIFGAQLHGDASTNMRSMSTQCTSRVRDFHAAVRRTPTGRR